jgi:SEC-C motif/Tetratricopeptide repeat
VVGRNDRCPCGSGKRYKDCHGVLQPGTLHTSGPSVDLAQQDIEALMQKALLLQQEGRLADAIANYEAVITREPSNFDALHMLGVAWFQSNQLDRAEHYVRRALAIRSDIIAAQSNMALINDTRRLEAMETELCRRVLPRMSALCQARASDWRLARQTSLDLVVAARGVDVDDRPVIQRIVRDSRYRTVAWKTGLTRVDPELDAATKIHDAESEPGPVSDFMLVYGCDVPAEAWMRAPRPAHIALIINADVPCRMHDRIRELSAQGRSPIGLIFNRVELKSSLQLPGLLLDEWFAAEPL